MRWAAAMGRLAAVVALTAVVTVAAAGVAAAHAVLLTSSPVAGSRLDAAPTDVALTFSEPVTPVALDVTGPEGQPATPDGADSFDGTAAVVEVPLRPNLPDGVYVVSWQVVSADSHPLRGAFEFAIGPFTPRGVIAAPDSPSTLVEIGYTITRWFGFAGLVLLVGATIFLLRVWQGGRRPRVWAVPAAGAAIATLASVGQIILQGPYTGQSLEEVVGSTFGTTLLLRMALLITAAATVVLFARWPTSPADQLVVGGPVALGL